MRHTPTIVTQDARDGENSLWSGLVPVMPGRPIRSVVVRVVNGQGLTAALTVQTPGFFREFHVSRLVNPARFAVGSNEPLDLNVTGIFNLAGIIPEPVKVELHWSTIPVETDRDRLYFWESSPAAGVFADAPEGALEVVSSLADPAFDWQRPLIFRSVLAIGIPSVVEGNQFRPSIPNLQLKWQLSPI